MPVTAPDPVVPAYSTPTPAAPGQPLAGWTPPPWPAASATALRVTGTVAPPLDGVLLPAGTKNGKPYWTHNGNSISGDPPQGTAGICLYWNTSGPGSWILIGWSASVETGRWYFYGSAVDDPTTITDWIPGTSCVGEPTFTLAGQAAPVLPRHNPAGYIEPPAAVIPRTA